MTSSILSYEELAKKSLKYFSWVIRDNNETTRRIKHYFTSSYQDALVFSNLSLTINEILIFSYATAILTFLGLIIIDSCVILFYYFSAIRIDMLTILLLITTTCFLPIITMNLVASYPKINLRYKKIHSLGDIPEVLSYLVMYLKLVPNLERSVRFAATESTTSLAQDFQKMLWDMQIRVHHGINDALTHFASQWGNWSDHLKRSLHLIRSSIHEPDEAQREITLNKALDVGLEGTRDLMNEFAQKLHQPTMIIYSLGIMIPLAIIAMLPAAGLIGLQITIFQMFFIYDIILPIIIFLYMRKILISRPATFNPPKIPADHPDIAHINKQKHFLIAVMLGFFISIPGFLSLFFPMISPYLGFLGNSFDQINNIVPLTLTIMWGIAIAVAYYSYRIYHPTKKIRDTIKHMEKEFSDALYIMGKRIGEEKSPEESFLYTARNMEGSDIASLFSQTGYNLTAIHTTLDQALFNTEYGSLKHIYSERIRAIMRLFVEGIKKSQQSVSVSLVKLADHLKELQLVESKIKETLSTLTATLSSTAAFFAPMIAGVTLSITQLISAIIQKLSSNMENTSLSATPGSTFFSGISHTFSLENIQPEYFVLVIGFYIIELVILLTRFTNGIDEGDDMAEYMYMLGKTMPVAIAVLTISILLSHLFLSSIALHI